ncbi:hypothetical protein SporoP37_16365 [Sporosarcina sp. P37]|uniref:hypothetical protein n=1 Tax=unclassified Sporosarcina TaxID=2647733 RepID=UPI000A17F6DD|nr:MULTISPECIES: hypothetical protein [unclassified Sporosarcina]ARK26094.1 hypothetical protein SporoP37_16365 [Sporosarcina sp. P37]PID19463.1 hypothetical protein CSV62_02885 [Sporosarcina sp. P35]
MEQLIILVIMLAMGSLFGKKKDDEKQKQPPKRQPNRQWPAQPTQRELKEKTEPQRTNAAPAEKPRSLKELSKNLFEDIQKEFQDLQQETQEPTVKTQAPQSEIFYAEPKKPVTTVSAPRQERQKGRGRLNAQQSVMHEEEQILQEDLIPRTSQQILQGIVYSEILGPPKSKR